MLTICRVIISFGRDRKAVTALEYGLIAAVMGSLIVSAFSNLGGKMNTAFSTIGNVMVTKTQGM